MKRREIREIDAYDPSKGVTFEWSGDAWARIVATGGEVVLRANRPGLTALADCLLALADPEVPVGSHLHLDDFSFLTRDSLSIVLELAAELTDENGRPA